MREQNIRLKIFISSVQKEFAAERRALKEYLTHDALLSRFIDEVFLFEDVPACNQSPDDIYLPEVAGCDIYLALLGAKYGWRDANGKSPTELEFDHATKTHRERLVFVKGSDDVGREPEMVALIRKAGNQVTRRRFSDTPELIREVYASMVDALGRRGALRLTPFDGTVCLGATLQDIDDAHIAEFLEMAGAKGRLTFKGARSTKAVLQNFNLLPEEKPTNAAVLLFGKTPSKFFTNAQVHCFHFLGTEKRKPIASQQPYEGTLFEVIDQAVEFVLGKLDRRVGTRAAGTRAPVAYEIPRSVVTEAIVNAVAHRNYASNGFVQVLVFADRVEVWNPGELPPGLTPELLREPHGPIPRNPLIAEPLFRVQYVEKAGTGTTDMISDCREAGLPEPQFKQHGPHFVVTLWRDWLTEEVLARLDLNEQQMLAVKHLKSTGRISNSEYRKLTGASESTALRELRQLAALGIVEKSKETGQSAHYVYVKTEPVTNPSNPSAARTKGTRHEPVKPVKHKSQNQGMITRVTLKNRRFIQEKPEKSKPLAGKKMARKGTVTAPVAPQVTMQVTPQVTMQVTMQVRALLNALEGERMRKSLQDKLGLQNRDNFEKVYLRPALEARLLERTIPDKPNSRLQRYRLTSKGRALLDTLNKKGSKA
jgi:ATP-dependent DNA helicase RecG